MRIWIQIPCTGRRLAFSSSLRACIWIFCALLMLLVFYYFVFPIYSNTSHNTSDVLQDKITYGIVIDCGSSGSRIFVYYWTPHDGLPHKLLNIHLYKDKNNSPIVMKVEPGLSAFANNPQNVGSYLYPLLNYVSNHIPATKVSETPLYILATAGMRLLDEKIQINLMDAVYRNISTEFRFLFPRTHVEVISGKQEGIFSWISVNYALGKLDQNISNTKDKLIAVEISGVEKLHIRKRTVGVLDLGGASLQMAFELPNSLHSNKNADNIVELNLGCQVDSLHLKYRLFVTTYLSYGSNLARQRYKSHLANIAFLKINKSEVDYSLIHQKDPCILRGKSDSHFEEGRKITIEGSGNFSECFRSLSSLINNFNCTNRKCALDGSFLPDINFKNSEFYGFSEFYYTMEDILHVGGKYDHFKFKKKAEEYCHTDWNEVETWKNETKHPKADDNRYLLQCFKSAWMIQVLHEGLRFPYFYKQLTSLQSVADNEVHWSLGAILYKTKYFPLRDIENNLATQHFRSHKNNLNLLLSSMSNLFQSPLIFIALILIILLIVYILSIMVFKEKFYTNDNYHK